jgi:hypothetical protein
MIENKQQDHIMTLMSESLKEHKVFETNIKDPKRSGKLFNILDILSESTVDSGTVLRKDILDELVASGLQELDDVYNIIGLCMSDGVTKQAKLEGCYDRIDEIDSIDKFLTGYYHENAYEVIVASNVDDSSYSPMILDELVRITKPNGYVIYSTSNKSPNLTAIAEKVRVVCLYLVRLSTTTRLSTRALLISIPTVLCFSFTLPYHDV